MTTALPPQANYPCVTSRAFDMLVERLHEYEWALQGIGNAAGRDFYSNQQRRAATRASRRNRSRHTGSPAR